MPQPAEQNCGNCRFLIDTYKDGYPRCHRFPPQAADETHFSEDSGIPRTPMEIHVWRFPEVHKEDWCGEWQQILSSGSISAYDKE